MLPFVNKSNLSCYLLRLERTSGLWRKVQKLNLSVDQRILFLSKNNFTAHYLVFAFVV